MKFILIAVIFLFLLFLGAGLFVVRYAMTRRDRTQLFADSTVAPSARIKYRDEVEKGVAWFEAQSSETLSLTSRDGLKLKALLIAPPSPKGSIVALHGFRSWPSREFAMIAKLMYDEGYAVLYPYQRSHRLSEGTYITFGVKERYDCADWANILAKRYPGLPMYLYGQSMGGATVLLADNLSLPKEVEGVVCDCGFAEPAAVVKGLFKSAYSVPAYPLILFVDLWTRLLGGFSLFSVNAKDTMQAKYRYLFIHGTEDDMVFYPLGLAAFEACPGKKRMLTVPGTGHCACWYAAQEQYAAALKDFLAGKEPPRQP